MNAQMMQHIIGFIRKVAGSLFANLPLLFAIAAAIGLARDEKPTAALAAVIGFITFHVGVNFSLLVQGLTPATTSVAAFVEKGYSQTEAVMYSAEFASTLGIFSYQMSVLGGVIAGMVTVMLHNRFYTIKLPAAIAYFGGRRFVPIITVVVLPLVGVLMSLIWPVIATAIIHIGEFIGESGPFGTFVYAFTERILIPTGLHHILNETVRFTPVGEEDACGGKAVNVTVADNVAGGVDCEQLIFTSGTLANSIVEGKASPVQATVLSLVTTEPVAFRNRANGDYQLTRLAQSCLDCGDDAQWTDLKNAVDLLGNPRKRGRHVDLGCYELVPGLMLILR